MNITKEFIDKNLDKRFTITFENGIVLKNIKLFISTIGIIGYLDKNRKRSGSRFPIEEKIKSIVEVKKKQHNKIDNAKTILKKIHPNAWNNLRSEMISIINGEDNQDFNMHFIGKLKFKNISNLLSIRERENLKDAFENKTQFRWSKNTNHHSGRDLSISVILSENGDLKAYFSSEFMGCGNGDYWLLLNPTTAIFYERD